jgi:DNA-nicking Smr family endonuclease
MVRKRDPSAGKKPGLKDEDRALWQHVTRDTKPLAKREPPPARSAAAAPETPPKAIEPKASKATKPARVLPRPPPAAPPRRAEPALEHGRIAGVDRRSATRLKRGQLPVEARLDLHGFTQSQAHSALDRFLDDAQARSLRCVLVITGKGTGKETGTGAGGGAGGVLRTQVPRWLNEPANRARVLGFDYAHKHGGLGALYVMMRRRKG